MTVRTARGWRRHGLAVAMVLTAGLVTGFHPAESATTDWVANPSFATDTDGWTVSDDGRVDRVVTSDYTAARFKSRKGKHTVELTSDPSSDVLPAASTLAVTVKVQTPSSGPKVGVKAREVDDAGHIVSQSTWSSSKKTTRWRSAELTLKSVGTGHRFSLQVIGHSLKGSKSVKVREVSAELTTAKASDADVTTTPSPSPSPSPTPTPSSTPTTTPPPVTGPAGPVRPCTTAQLTQLDDTKGTLAFDDEFDGTGVDTNRWRVRNETTLSFDQARIMAANVAVHDGLLSITARRESIQGRDYTTGYLDTIGKFSRRFGRWEIRGKLPTAPGVSRGLWPAFWLRADQQFGEIDVMEAWGDPTSRSESIANAYSWTLHENTNSPPGSHRYGGWGRQNAPLADAFHIWAVDWSPGCLSFSMDGKNTGSVAADSAPWLASALAGPVNIRLNLQVGNSYWGFADATKPEQTRLPASFLVDYVRVYQPAG
jgi:beta-glucanase (GH16 family)